MVRLGGRHILKWLSVTVCLLLPSLASAQDQDAADSLPGSSRPGGLGMSPEAPTAPPAPGGRAPSFGAPVDPDAWTFRIGGRISGFTQLGIGREPSDRSQSGTPFHTPPAIVGRSPFYAGPGGTLTFQYGNQMIQAFASLEASLTGQEWEGYYRGENGPRLRTAYVAVTPPAIGDLKLRFQVGAFPSNYGAPGPWGWGVYGPVLAVHGYGGNAVGTYALTPTTQLYMEYGIQGVPLVDESQVRGTYTDWPEVGLSTIVHHGHIGLSFDNKYFAKLHLARADGRNFTVRSQDVPATTQRERGPDGYWDIAALELRWVGDPYGQLGITPVYWNFSNAQMVHNGIWWGLDWTAGGREMSRKFLGPGPYLGPGRQTYGNGKLFAVSAEYNFSLSRILSHPKPFDGNGPDLRVNLAFLPYWALESEDVNYDGSSGYYVGAVLEHVITSWLSTTYTMFGESRDNAINVYSTPRIGRFTTYSGTVGLVLHSDWQSQDRLVLAYSRYFYSNFTDSNPQKPLDRDVFTLGGSVAF